MSRRGCALALLTVVLALLAPAASALADGDPGSDVLVNQDLFVGSDAGLSIGQQAKFEGLLQAAAKAGFPIRVAIISSPTDLGAITELWRSPRQYVRYLGIELSLSYKQRLLVVMPNGFGFSWPGHQAAPAYAQLAKIPIAPGGTGMLNAAQAGVQALATAAHVKLAGTGPATPAPGSALAAGPGALNSGTAAAGGGSGSSALWIVLIVLVLVTIVLATVWVRRRGAPRLRLKTPRPGAAVAGLATLFAVAAGASIIAIGVLSTSSRQSQTEALASNPDLDPGTPIGRTAPDFTLSDQFGRSVSLHSYRGKVVILAFTDSVCTTICPMTTSAMVDAKAMLGAAGSHVQLLGVDANPAATSLEDVWSYSELHGLLREWRFLTGSQAQLERVWKDYAIEAAVEGGEITHTPALFVISPDGREAKVYITQESYSAIGQLGEVLAQEAARLLPGHPKLDTSLSYAQVPAIPPTHATTLPKAGGGTVSIGGSGSPQLHLFFATWDQQVTSMAGQLAALDAYQSRARRAGLPQLTAVDEGSVEPSSSALAGFLRQLPHPLDFPVAVDRSGRVADGYEVQGVPWFVLTSPSGQILWYWEVDTSGWLGTQALVKHVRAALAHTPAAPTNLAAAQKALAGSPAPLAALHRQAATLLGSESALEARIKQLRGYPIVINAWASWCVACRSEFGLFAAASAQYGRKVAFLGADTEDSAGDARSFLAQHPVSYPSYQAATDSDLSRLAVIEGLPTTIYIDAAGKVVYVHTGQYDSQGTLDEDISSYSAGG